MSKFIHFDKIDSTSSYLKCNYNKYDNFTFVSANFQTNGRGRNGRSWINGSDDLLFSILLKDEKIIQKYNLLSIISSYVIIETLNEYGISNAMYKWPNDVYVNNKKICGILLEGISTSNSINALIIGVGLNVNSDSFSNELTNKATSMYLELNKNININELKQRIYDKFLLVLENIDNCFIDILKKIRTLDYLKDKEVYISYNNEKKKIKVIDVNDDGSLKVILDNKQINIYSGEVTFSI